MITPEQLQCHGPNSMHWSQLLWVPDPNSFRLTALSLQLFCCTSVQVWLITSRTFFVELRTLCFWPFIVAAFLSLGWTFSRASNNEIQSQTINKCCKITVNCINKLFLCCLIQKKVVNVAFELCVTMFAKETHSLSFKKQQHLH